MSVTVGDVYRAIDAFAPFEAAEDWDNAGLLAGAPDAPVARVLCALDLNFGVMAEAEELGAELIVTHHPILFRGRKNLREDDAEGRLLCRLIRAKTALIAAHTNFDNAFEGVNDALAERLGLEDVCDIGQDGMRDGLIEATSLGAFAAFVSERIGAPVRRYGEEDRIIRRVALLGGAGGDFAPQALEAGADVYITGEIAHHKAWAAYESGLCVLECGHAATEAPAVGMMAGKLRAAFGDRLEVIESRALLFK